MRSPRLSKTQLCETAATCVVAITALALASCGGDGTTDYSSAPTATLPAQMPAPTIVGAPGGAPPPATSETYVIQPDDTVAGIAERYGVTIETILNANPGLDPARLTIGDEIIVPKPAPTANTSGTPTTTRTPQASAVSTPQPSPTRQASGGVTTYTVQAGDYPEAIAQRFGITTEELLAANPGIDPSSLSIGQVLKIPAASGGD